MSVVKGSKQKKMIVVEHRPLHDFSVRAGIFLCMVAIGAGAYLFGHVKGVYESVDARVERDNLRSELEANSAQLSSLRQQVVNVEQASIVDKQALEEVQGVILELRDTNAQLEENILFYKQIMAPEDDEQGLAIGQVDLLITEDDRKIRYRIEFKQLANNENFIRGYANVSISGLQNSQPVTLPLRSLSPTEGQIDIRLQFRYFQNLEGDIVLPENFIPDKVQITAVSEGSNGKTVQKNFSWLVQM